MESNAKGKTISPPAPCCFAFPLDSVLFLATVSIFCFQFQTCSGRGSGQARGRRAPGEAGSPGTLGQARGSLAGEVASRSQQQPRAGGSSSPGQEAAGRIFPGSDAQFSALSEPHHTASRESLSAGWFHLPCLKNSYFQLIS